MTGPLEKESPGAGGTATGANRNVHPEDIPSNDRLCKTVPLWRITDDLFDRIEKAFYLKQALRIDRLDLWQLSESYLPFWLDGAPSIIASTIEIGRAIRAAYVADGLQPPPIYIAVPA